MGTRISELPNADSVTNDTIAPVVQGNTTKKLNLGSIVTKPASELTERPTYNTFKYESTSNSGSVSSSATNYTTIGSAFTLSPGMWIVTLTVTFSKNGTGFREARILSTDETTGDYVVCAAASGQATRVQVVYMIKISGSSSKTYNIKLRQNSGSSLNYSATYKRMGIQHNY